MFRTLQFLQPSTYMLNFSSSYPSYKTIYWGVWRAVNLTAICMKTIQMRTATRFVLWGRKFIQFEHAASFILPMICSGTWTQSTPEHTPTLCSDLQRQKKGPRLIGMQGSLASIMPMFGLNEQISQTLGGWSGWIFFECAGSEGSLNTLQVLAGLVCLKLALSSPRMSSHSALWILRMSSVDATWSPLFMKGALLIFFLSLRASLDAWILVMMMIG